LSASCPDTALRVGSLQTPPPPLITKVGVEELTAAPPFPRTERAATTKTIPAVGLASMVEGGIRSGAVLLKRKKTTKKIKGKGGGGSDHR